MKKLLAILAISGSLFSLTSQAATSDLTGTWTGEYTVTATPTCSLGTETLSGSAKLIINTIDSSGKITSGTLQLDHFPDQARGDLPDYSNQTSIEGSTISEPQNAIYIMYNGSEKMNGSYTDTNPRTITLGAKPDCTTQIGPLSKSNSPSNHQGK